jgi:hypothetical protein
MSNPKLALIPSGYQGGSTPKVYSILPNDGSGDFTFDRDTVATRVRKDGLIEEVAADIPRLDWFNSNCPNLLLEPSSANLVPYSEDFSQWTVSSTTVSASTIPAPTGKPTAYKLLATNSDANHQLNSDTFSIVSGAITGSLFVKKGNLNFIRLRFNGSTSTVRGWFDIRNGVVGTVDAGGQLSIEDYGNGWYRCTLTETGNTAATSSASLQIFLNESDAQTTWDADGDEYAYIFGAQIEQKSASTSYIPNLSTGSTTRNADVCTDAGDADLFDITEGSFYIDITPFINDASSRYISLSDSSSDNRIEYQLRSSANAIDVLCEGQNGGLEVQRTITISFNTRNKLLATFDDSSFKIYVNGSLDFTDTSFTKPTSLNRLSFANNSNNFAYQGKAHDVRVYDRVLTEAEAIKLTT